MKRRITKIALYGLLLLVCIFFVHIYLRDYITLEMLKEHKDFLRDLVTYNYGLAVFFYIAIYLAAIILMLPIISLLSLLGGFLFGPFWAMVFINAVATAGVIIVVAFIRYFLKENKINNSKRAIEHLNTMVVRHGIIYLLAVRLVFIIPFFVVNTVLALTAIPLRTIAWTTSLGIIPITFFFVSAGSQLEQINHLSDLASAKLMFILGFLAAILFVPTLLKKGKIL